MYEKMENNQESKEIDICYYFDDIFKMIIH